MKNKQFEIFAILAISFFACISVGILDIIFESEQMGKPIYVSTREANFEREFKLTAYCSCEKCCGKYAINRPLDEFGEEIVYGASGKRLKPGVSVAVDPKIIPYGSSVIINGHEYIAQDCGGAIKKRRIDVYFSDHQEALKFGVQRAVIEIDKPLNN